MSNLSWYETLPRKRTSAGALFFNSQGQVLIVKPTYRDDWLLPGGTVEEDESPWQGCLREVEEELSIQVTLLRLLCIDYAPREGEKNEALHFVFDGEVLSQEQIAQIVLPQDELSEYRFLTLEEACTLVNGKIAKRLPWCVQAHQEQATVYLERGEERR